VHRIWRFGFGPALTDPHRRILFSGTHARHLALERQALVPSSCTGPYLPAPAASGATLGTTQPPHRQPRGETDCGKAGSSAVTRKVEIDEALWGQHPPHQPTSPTLPPHKSPQPGGTWTNRQRTRRFGRPRPFDIAAFIGQDCRASSHRVRVRTGISPAKYWAATCGETLLTTRRRHSPASKKKIPFRFPFPGRPCTSGRPFRYALTLLEGYALTDLQRIWTTLHWNHRPHHSRVNDGTPCGNGIRPGPRSGRSPSPSDYIGTRPAPGHGRRSPPTPEVRAGGTTFRRQQKSKECTNRVAHTEAVVHFASRLLPDFLDDGPPRGGSRRNRARPQKSLTKTRGGGTEICRRKARRHQRFTGSRDKIELQYMRFAPRLRAIIRQRCPVCLEGKMFSGRFTMNPTCPVCGHGVRAHVNVATKPMTVLAGRPARRPRTRRAPR